jgi:hypothetical protein
VFFSAELILRSLKFVKPVFSQSKKLKYPADSPLVRYVRITRRTNEPKKNHLKSSALGQMALLVKYFSLVFGNNKKN